MFNDTNCTEKKRSTNLLNNRKIEKIEFDKIEIKNLNFKYNNSVFNLFENANLIINKGDSIGIIGPSGSGKSTLIDIFLGLIKPNSGKILYNNEELDINLNQWHSNIAFIPQDIYVVNDTIKNNVALGQNDKDFNYQRFINAIKASNLIKFINDLPNKESTILGENGVTISGGQKQRIALARAMYFKKNIIIMDEATSSLDYETEEKISTEIHSIDKKITKIIISHRETILQKCHKIFEIKDKKLSR